MTMEVAGLLKKKREGGLKVWKEISGSPSWDNQFHMLKSGRSSLNRITVKGYNSEEEFMKKIEEEISENLKHESDFKLMQDVKKLIIEKLNLHSRRNSWEMAFKVNEKTTESRSTKNLDSFRHDLKWQL